MKLQNENSVAFISTINSLTAINGADKIELATVEGWTSTVEKNIHTVGSQVICITTDAVIPQHLAEQWGVAQYLRKGNRVRTVKLRGVYSECILIPTKDLYLPTSKYVDGEDMMGLLGIVKYEPPLREETLPSGKKVRYSSNPNFHVYYKFPNQKNVKDMFKEGDECVITRKIHGTNARYGIVQKTEFTLFEKIKKFFGIWSKWDNYEYVYGSHNVQKLNDSKGYYADNYWAEIDKQYSIKEQLWNFFKVYHEADSIENIVIYGEIYGPGVQGESFNYGQSKRTFAGFDVKLNNEYLSELQKNLVFTQLALWTVDVLYQGKWSKEIQDKYVLNNFIQGTKVPHEGVVVSCPTGDRQKICKVINPDYIIYSEKNNIPDSH